MPLRGWDLPHKVCGEFICGVSDDVLEGLGISECLSDAEKLRSVSWFYGNRKLREDRLPVTALGLSRWELDRRLADLFVECGGQLKINHRMEPRMIAGWIHCAGRQADRSSSWIGLKCHLQGISSCSDLEMFASPGGYVGLSRIEGDVMNLCGLFRLRRGLPSSRESLLFRYLEMNGFSDLADRIKDATVVAGSQCAVNALNYSKPTRFLPRQIHLGDAHGLIPPFTGNGMSVAFESAWIARDAIAAWSSGKVSWEKTCRDIYQRQAKQFHGRLWRARLMHIAVTHPYLTGLTAGCAASPLFPFHTAFIATH